MFDKLPDRVRSKIARPEDPDGCWLWSAALDRHGYGVVRWESRAQRAHRVVYSLLIDDPGPLVVDHLCRVHRCVNPQHLEAVPQTLNIKRGMGPALTKTLYAVGRECPRGHVIDGDNLYAHVTKAGYVNKQCRICRSIKKREQNDRLKKQRAELRAAAQRRPTRS